jgi:hypothetical protein
MIAHRTALLKPSEGSPGGAWAGIMSSVVRKLSDGAWAVVAAWMAAAFIWMTAVVAEDVAQGRDWRELLVIPLFGPILWLIGVAAWRQTSWGSRERKLPAT